MAGLIHFQASPERRSNGLLAVPVSSVVACCANEHFDGGPVSANVVLTHEAIAQRIGCSRETVSSATSKERASRNSRYHPTGARSHCPGSNKRGVVIAMNESRQFFFFVRTQDWRVIYPFRRSQIFVHTVVTLVGESQRDGAPAV